MYLGKMTMTVHGKGVQNGPHVRVNLNVKNVSVPGGTPFPYITYTGMCRWTGYGFFTSLS